MEKLEIMKSGHLELLKAFDTARELDTIKLENESGGDVFFVDFWLHVCQHFWHLIP